MSSVSGSGVGGSGGGPLNPLPIYQELSATDQGPRLLLNITKNTDDILFATFGRASSGPDKRDFYRSDSSNPNLPRPLNIFRVGAGLVDHPSINSEANYQRLLNMLPDDQKEDLKRDQQLPPNQRSLYLQAMNEVLQSAATVLTYFEAALTSIALEPAQIGALRNAAVPLIAIGLNARDSGSIANGSREILETIGRNDPSHDNVSLVTRTISGFSTQLNDLIRQISDQGLTPDLQARLTAMSNQAFEFLPQAGVLLNSGDLGVLMTNLAMMSLIAGAAGLLDVSSALLIGASAVLVGLGDSPLGIVAAGVSNGLLALAFPNADAATGNLLTGIATIGLIAAAAIAANMGPEGNPTAVEAFKQELGLILLCSTGIISTLYGDLAAAMGADANGQAIVSAGLTALGLLMIAYVWTPSTSGDHVRISEGIALTLSGHLTKLAEAIDEAIRNDALDARASAFAASLQQAAIALERGDMDTFQSVLHQGLNHLGITWNDLEQTLSNILALAQTSTTALDPANAHPPTSTIPG